MRRAAAASTRLDTNPTVGAAFTAKRTPFVVDRARAGDTDYGGRRRTSIGGAVGVTHSASPAVAAAAPAAAAAAAESQLPRMTGKATDYLSAWPSATLHHM